MGFQKYYTISSLIEDGKKRAEEKDIITFDLFDTLLIRRVHDPDLVKLPVARYIAERASLIGIQVSWQKVMRTRNILEKENRAHTAESFKDHEAHYPTFMEKTLKSLFLEQYTSSILDDVTDYELLMESSMLVPRKEFMDWLPELVEQGKRILIISDIYLPSKHLENLVEQAGLTGFVEGVVSSADTFLAKASGEAFPLVQKQYGFDKDKWLHIGDNPVSDGLQPSAFGIESLVLHDRFEKQRKGTTRRYLNYAIGKPFWRGRALQQLMMPHEGENQEKDDLYIEGYNFLAPLIGGFIQELAEKCRKGKISKIFFLSREGWTFKRYWEQAIPLMYPDGNLPEIEYLYVSRMALAGSTCAHQGLTKDNVAIAFLPSGNRDFRDVCRIFSMDAEKFTPIFVRHKIAIDTCLSPVHEGYVPRNMTRFNEMMEDPAFQDEVKKQTADQNLAMNRYFEDAGMFDHEDVAVVDIGWLGTIQRFLYEGIKHRDDCPRIHGFLFSATRGIPYPEIPGNTLEGLVFDRYKFDLAASSILYARDVFEEACRAPYPTLNGYRLKDDGYELEFRQTDDQIGKAELKQDSYFAPLQQGIFDASKRYGAATAILGYSLADYKPWFNYLMVSKLAFPRTREVANIRHRHHLDDFHGKHQAPTKHTRRHMTLWDHSLLKLRLSPLMRLRYFMKHLRDRIKE